MTDSDTPDLLGLVPAPPKELPPAYPDRAAWGTATRLRAWQSDAIGQYFATDPRDFLAVATPGLFGPSYFLEVGEVMAAAAGGPPDMAAVMAVMRRHGLTPAPPAG